MTTSGTHTFEPNFAEIFDEAWERIGRDPASIGLQEVVSAQRSLNLLLTSDLSQGFSNLWKAEEYSTTPAVDATSFALPAGAIDVLYALTRLNGYDTPMTPLGAIEWQEIPNKTPQMGSRPDRYWVERLRATRTFHFWNPQPTPQYTIVLRVLYALEDAGDLTNTPDVPERWMEVVCAGLAARLAVKYAPDRLGMLRGEFMAARKEAESSNRERTSIFFMPDNAGWRR